MKKHIFIIILLSCFVLNAQVDSTGIQSPRMVDFQIDSTQFDTNELFSSENFSISDTLETTESTEELPGTKIEYMQRYNLKELQVSGGTPYSTNQILRFTGLEIGEEIEVPGAKINNAIKKLWRTNLFSDVEFFATKVVGSDVYLRVNLVALPTINEVEIVGVKKSDRETFLKENKLSENAKLTQNLINQTRINIRDYYTEKGFPDAKIDFTTTPVEGRNLAEDVKIVVDRGPRVKIKDIRFHGNDELNNSFVSNCVESI